MIRTAAALILVSQLLLVWVGLAPNGTSAIWFTFVGAPCVIAGVVLGGVALRRSKRQAEDAER